MEHELLNAEKRIAGTKQVLRALNAGTAAKVFLAKDADGFIYFKQRIKRMIVTSGYNVYPSQLENAFDAHEKVHMSCIIGVPDPIKKQKVKAFIMLKPGIKPSDDVKSELMEYAKKNISKYALPYDIEFREDLPKTLVGKVAYRKLEEEELSKLEEN